MRFSIEQIIEAVSGTLVVAPADTFDVQGVTWDSRTVCAGDMYVALPGDRVDGHAFIVQAFEAGARCVLVTCTPDEEAMRAAHQADGAIVQVEDGAQAITDLATAWRACLTGVVVGITGSSGKTTTKDLVAAVLGAHGSVVATHKNQNNELGVPNTLLSAQEDTRYIVVEMGMRGRGQIERLCAFVKPDMALITNVGTSHMELLGSRDEIARAKAEIVLALGAGGVAFLNAQDDYTPFIRNLVQEHRSDVDVRLYDGSGQPDTGGKVQPPSAFATDVSFDALGCPSFTMHTATGAAPCTLRLRGSHNVSNACAAAAVGDAVGMDVRSIADALARVEPIQGRQATATASCGAAIVDDSYNANPDSMRASLQTFSVMDVPGKRYAVLGDMGELGHYSQQAHAEIGRVAATSQLDGLVCVGPYSVGMAAAAREAGMSCVREVADAHQAADAIVEMLTSQDAVLVKASHSMGLDYVVEELVKSHA